MQAYQRRKLVLAFKHCILHTSLWNVSKQYYFNHNTLLYNLIHVKLPPYLLPSLVEDIGTRSIASGLCHAGDHAIRKCSNTNAIDSMNSEIIRSITVFTRDSTFLYLDGPLKHTVGHFVYSSPVP